MKFFKRFVSPVLALVALPIILVAAWWLYTVNDTNFFVPEPVQLVDTFVSTWITGERFTRDVIPSLQRLGLGLIIAIILGILLGLLIGLNKTVRSITEPTFEFFRALPPPVLIPVLMLLIGVGNTMQVTVIVAGSIWPILLNTIEGVRGIDPVQSETSKSYGITGLRRVRHQILPAATPQIMAGVRQSLSIALILMVISEMFATSSGLGFTIVQFQRSFAIPEMWSGIALLGIIGVTLSFIFQFVERRVLRWYHGVKEVENAA